MVNLFGLMALLMLSISLGLLSAFGALSFALYCMRRNQAPRAVALEEPGLTDAQVIHSLAA